MSIDFIQMTAGQSDNNSHKSKHDTLQLRCLNYKLTNLRVQARGEVSHGNQFQWVAIAKPRGNQIGAIGDREQRS